MNEDQTLLMDAAERYLRDSYDFNARRERLANGTYADPVHWQAFAEMGWLALPVPEILDGLGMGTRECAILAELCGQYLVTEPLIDVLAAISALIGPSPQAEHWVGDIANGGVIPIATIDEGAGRRSENPSTTLTQTATGWRLTGAKHWISAGPSATHFIVLAAGEQGLAWVLCPRDAEVSPVKSSQRTMAVAALTAHSTQRSTIVRSFFPGPMRKLRLMPIGNWR